MIFCFVDLFLAAESCNKKAIYEVFRELFGNREYVWIKECVRYCLTYCSAWSKLKRRLRTKVNTKLTVYTLPTTTHH